MNGHRQKNYLEIEEFFRELQRENSTTPDADVMLALSLVIQGCYGEAALHLYQASRKQQKYSVSQCETPARLEEPPADPSNIVYFPAKVNRS